MARTRVRVGGGLALSALELGDLRVYTVATAKLKSMPMLRRPLNSARTSSIPSICSNVGSHKESGSGSVGDFNLSPARF